MMALSACRRSFKLAAARLDRTNRPVPSTECRKLALTSGFCSESLRWSRFRTRACLRLAITGVPHLQLLKLALAEHGSIWINEQAPRSRWNAYTKRVLRPVRENAPGENSSIFCQYCIDRN